jgi:hypothetical protein
MKEPIKKVRDCHSRESFESSLFKNFWTPAFAGATPFLSFAIGSKDLVVAGLIDGVLVNG